AVANHLTALPNMVDSSLAGQISMFEAKLAKAAIGCGCTLLLYLLYRRLLPRLTLPALGAVALAASLAAGLVWEIGIRIIFMWPLFEAEMPRDALYPSFVLVAWSALYFSFAYRQRADVEAERALRATALATEAQLAMLRYQVNPHFLFNALNSLRALIDENKGSARDMVTQLSELFRYSLRTTHETDLSLGDEIAAIRNYLDIQKIRFEDGLEATIDVDEAAAATPLPGFLVHPLVENSVKYGLETSPRPLRVEVRARREGNRLRVEVANTGRWLDGAARDAARISAGTGTGLRNLRERLRHIYPDRHALAVGEVDGWVRAVMVLDLDRAQLGAPA
ncbi:MAG TPA: histidine kinase, partial [Kofleriaceae bacterium]|nr:histidine kinase [Kofleriaceae bacterium]